MSSIKEQKLELYRKYLVQSDRTHFIIRGLKGEELKTEEERMWNEYHSKVHEVPKGYTLKRLQFLVHT